MATPICFKLLVQPPSLAETTFPRLSKHGVKNSSQHSNNYEHDNDFNPGETVSFSSHGGTSQK
jgi:hypothetical protein